MVNISKGDLKMQNQKRLIEQRRQKYHQVDCEPYKVTFYMKNEVCLNDYLMFDSLLAYCVMKDIFQKNYENVTNSDELFDVPLPLKRTGKIWHASAGIFEVIDTDQGSWKKRWDNQNENLVNPHRKRTGKYSLKIDVGSGKNKAYSMPLQLYLTRKIEFYVNGDGPEIMRLLGNYISAVGKKRSQGYGFVQKMEIKKIDKDKSIFKDGKIMRPITTETLINEFENKNELKMDYQRRYMPVKPPYWNASESIAAAAPKFINIIGE